MPVLQTLNTSLIQSLQSMCGSVEGSNAPVAVRSNEIFDEEDEDHNVFDRRGDPDCDDLEVDADFSPLALDAYPSLTPAVRYYEDAVKKPSLFPGGIEPVQYSLRDWLALRQTQPQSQRRTETDSGTAQPQALSPDLAPQAAPSIRPQPSDALHLACCRPRVTPAEIERLLRNDPAAVTRSVALTSYKSVYSPILKQKIKKLVKEAYTYPLNLAIQHGACNQVLEMLADAAPQVLTTFDGSLREAPIFVFLKYHPHNCVLFDKLLLDCPSVAYMKDRHDNTITHVGARQGVSLEMIRHMVILNPESLRQRNFHGRTPLELAQQRTSLGTDAVATYLLEKVHDPKCR
jgi:hypothetical protein